MQFPERFRRSDGLSLLVSLLVVVGAAVPVPAQAPSSQSAAEQRRERNERMDDIFRQLGVRPGAVVADVGAGSGFYTVRLSRAVGESGRVLAVDVSPEALGRLRRRMADEGLTNVDVIAGQPADPRLPDGALDAALIVNAYHEMVEHQAMLEHIRKALKPDGRLVIVDQITSGRRDSPRADQTGAHETSPELAQQDARAAGFRIAGFEDPFSTSMGHGTEWMLVLAPGAAAPAAVSAPASTETALSSPALRISQGDFLTLYRAKSVVVLDVRDDSFFARGHIPGARLLPMSAMRDALEELRRAPLAIVTYCSCPAEEESARAAAYLRKQGLMNVRALLGGFERWQADGQPVARE